MSAEQLREFLAAGTRTAKLATTMRDGAPHVMPVWFVLDGDELVFNTGANTVKGRNLTRDPRASVLVDDERPPFAFVHMRGRVSLSEEPDELLRTATDIGATLHGRGPCRRVRGPKRCCGRARRPVPARARDRADRRGG